MHSACVLLEVCIGLTDSLHCPYVSAHCVHADCVPVHLRLTLGLLADASAEGLLLTRVNDTEAQDTALLPAEIDNFISRCKSLFLDRACLSGPTYTAIMVATLKRPLVWWSSSGTPQSLGSPDRTLVLEIESAVARSAILPNVFVVAFSFCVCELYGKVQILHV